MKRNLFIVIALAILVIAGIFAFNKYKKTGNVTDILKPTSQITVTVATPTDEYVEVKATTTRKIVWEALGFEPGFAFKIFSETESGKETITTNILTQEQELFSGILSGGAVNYSAELEDYNSKKKSKINISFDQKSCINPDGSTSTYTTVLKIGNKSMTGCANKFN